MKTLMPYVVSLSLFLVPYTADAAPNISSQQAADLRSQVEPPAVPTDAPAMQEPAVTLQSFKSALVVVNTNSEMDKRAEDILAHELQPLRISAVPEEMAWELFKLVMSSEDPVKYQTYLHQSYDVVIIANIIAKEEKYMFRFEVHNYRDWSLPLLYDLELQSEGPREITYQGVFRAFVNDLAVTRNQSLSEVVIPDEARPRK